MLKDGRTSFPLYFGVLVYVQFKRSVPNYVIFIKLTQIYIVRTLDTPEPTKDSEKECSISELRCSNGACVPQSWICDGEDDCSDATDEEDCQVKSTCSPGDFR